MEKIAVERIAKAVELFYRSLVHSLTGWSHMEIHDYLPIFHLSTYWIYITSIHFPIAHPASLFNNSSPY